MYFYEAKFYYVYFFIETYFLKNSFNHIIEKKMRLANKFFLYRFFKYYIIILLSLNKNQLSLKFFKISIDYGMRSIN
jgi:hypothetical protein